MGVPPGAACSEFVWLIGGSACLCARDMTAKSPRVEDKKEDVAVVAANPANSRDRDAR